MAIIVSNAPVFLAPRALGCAAVGLAVLLMAGGCARQKSDPNYYDPPAESSAADASNQARNSYGRGALSAPSQIQLGLKSGATAKAPAGEPLAGAEQAEALSAPALGHVGVIAQAQTYLGTLPCFHRDLQCTAQRVTLTLAPNGRWRARAGYLDTDGQRGAELIDQGCWRATTERSARIFLIERSGSVRAELVMTQGNALRVRAVNGETLSLAYNLTRQPDLDPIDAAPGGPALEPEFVCD